MNAPAPRVLGPDDEPQGTGAVVAVHYGNYRSQEIWVSSGANIGNWYALGGEFRVPKVAVDTRHPLDRIGDPSPFRPPPGQIPLHPVWADVLARGEVVLLVPGQNEAFANGWEAGRRRLLEQIEALHEDEDTPPSNDEMATRS